jgi:homoserine kinase
LHPADGITFRLRSEIPLARGLGSSAAAIVAGLVAADHLFELGLSKRDLLIRATELEGHPDNVAACLFGGLTIAWLSGSARAVRRDVDPAIVPVALVPPFTASTELARGLLPADVPHRDAAFSAGRAALLVAALTGTPQAVFDATEDRLHQAYRASAMPESARLVDQLRAGGHPAVISGAGPTVLVLARGEVEAENVLARTPPDWTGMHLPVHAAGAEMDR